MAKKPDTPCTVCGRLLWSRATSLPAELRICRECKRSESAPRFITWGEGSHAGERTPDPHTLRER
jgi:hypothetical protein